MEAHLIQRSPEWIEWKKTKISGTDSAKILNLNPWASALSLWEEKLSLRETQKMNSNMQRGVDLEPIALQLFNEITDSNFEPIVVEHPQEKWAIASLDGMNSKNEILEIKANGQKNHQLALDGIIPDYYLCQIQHCLWVSEADIAYYFSYTPESQKIIEVRPDLEFIEKMVNKEREFFKMLLDFTPPLACDRDFVKRDSRELQFHLEVWKQTKAEMKLLEAKDELLRDTIIKMCEGQSSECNGVRIAKQTTKGRVSYVDIPELKNVDLDKYRSKPVTSFRFTEIKGQDE
jgi:putative phage-type endonuclease